MSSLVLRAVPHDHLRRRRHGRPCLRPRLIQGTMCHIISAFDGCERQINLRPHCIACWSDSFAGGLRCSPPPPSPFPPPAPPQVPPSPPPPPPPPPPPSPPTPPFPSSVEDLLKTIPNDGSIAAFIVRFAHGSEGCAVARTTSALDVHHMALKNSRTKPEIIETFMCVRPRVSSQVPPNICPD